MKKFHLDRFTKIRVILTIGLSLLVFTSGLDRQAEACTDFLLNNSPYYAISGRTMDFAIDLEAWIKVVPRGQKFQSINPDSGAKGKSWKSKYGFAGIMSLNIICSDGLNSKGLSFAILSLNEAKYPTPPEKPQANFVMLKDVTEWILGNYANLTNQTLRCPIYKPFGYGCGMLGLPGDVTPPSRFVQASLLNRFVTPPYSVREAVANAIHILNQVQVANGEVAAGNHTQWSVVRDHKNLVLYFRDNQNSNLRAIELNKLDLSPNAPIKSMPLADPKHWYKCVNGDLK